MVQILRGLKINEISSVDRGAGANCKVLLWKRDDGPRILLFDEVMKARSVADDDADAENVLGPKLRQMVDALIAAAPSLSEEAAMHFLLHSPHGRRLGEHLNNLSKGEHPMNRSEELREIAKANGGMEVICKNIIDRGSTTISEHEFSAALMEHAKAHKRDGESTVSAFSRLLENDVELRKALGIVKGYPNAVSSARI